MRRLLVTGSREHIDQGFIWQFLDQYRLILWPDNLILIEGGAPGADRLAREWAIKYGVPYETYPANWDQFGKAAGPIRNQQMVDLGADVCLAFPLPKSIGTYDCARRAKEAGVETIYHHYGKRKKTRDNGFEQLSF